jgi:hypothetical protein
VTIFVFGQVAGDVLTERLASGIGGADAVLLGVLCNDVAKELFGLCDRERGEQDVVLLIAVVLGDVRCADERAHGALLVFDAHQAVVVVPVVEGVDADDAGVDQPDRDEAADSHASAEDGADDRHLDQAEGRPGEERREDDPKRVSTRPRVVLTGRSAEREVRVASLCHYGSST